MEDKITRDWKKELVRDFLALGSWIFYILVIGRALIKPYRPFADQIIIAGVILLLVSWLFVLIKKDYDGYVARGLILAVFTILFYEDRIFSIFAVAVLIGLIISSYFVGNNKVKIIKGLIIGGLASWISYYLAGFSFGLV